MAKRLKGWRAKSRWNLYEHGISSTLLTLFMKCMEQFRLSVCLGYRSASEPFPLFFGTSGHHCMQGIYSAPTIDWNGKNCGRLIEDYSKYWRKNVKIASQQQTEMLTKSCLMLQALLPAYVKYYAFDDFGRKGERRTRFPLQKIESVEKPFEVAFKLDDGRVIKVRGTRDLRGVTKKKQKVNLDHKFLSVIKSEDILEGLVVNTQQMLYLWADWKLGDPADAVMLNVVRRPGQRQGETESFAQTMERAKKEIEKKPEYYFQRYPLEVEPSDLREWEQKILSPWLHLLQMYWEGEIPEVTNPEALFSKYGRADMFDLIVKGDSTRYKIDLSDPLAYQGKVE